MVEGSERAVADGLRTLRGGAAAHRCIETREVIGTSLLLVDRHRLTEATTTHGGTSAAKNGERSGRAGAGRRGDQAQPERRAAGPKMRV